MESRLKIEGLEDTLKCLDQAPENLLKISRTASRDASKAVVKRMKGATPARWKELTKYKVSKRRDGKISATMGLYNGQQTGGHQPKGGKTFDWFKAYWLNYGTLENRDRTHKFQYPVKHKNTAAARRRKSRSGIKPQNFFEKAIAGWEETFQSAFEASLKKQEKKLYER